MKRLPAILFLFVLLFNFYGYRLVIASLEQNSVSAIERKADKKEYTDDELVSVKTGLNLPYYSSSKEFERAYGSININGTDYEYVKRRVYNDTLELLCLPNHGKTALKAVGNELAKAAADGSNGASERGGITVKLSFPDYCQRLNGFTASVYYTCTTSFVLRNTRFSSADYSLRRERPPQG